MIRTAPLLAIALVTLLPLPALGAESPPACDNLSLPGCGCILDANPVFAACGAVVVTCDGIGNGVGTAEGVSNDPTTAWEFDFSVTSVGYFNSQSSTGAVAAFKDVNSPLVSYTGSWTVHGRLYANGQLVASASIGCA